MKKYTGVIAGSLVVLAFVLYFFLTGQNGQNPAHGLILVSNTPTGTIAGTGTGQATTTASAYKDGTYAGPVTDAIYGQLQVVVTIAGGRITDVAWPVFPSDRGHTMEISQQALPQLKQEAITAQSANVDIVSGATQTSEAYQQSLAAALAMAKN